MVMEIVAVVWDEDEVVVGAWVEVVFLVEDDLLNKATYCLVLNSG